MIAPALAQTVEPAPHSGTPTPRTGPAASDIALFVVAALGVIVIRRALRARFRKRRGDRP